MDMSFLRFIGRSLFASVFIVDGLKKVTKPAEQADDAAKVTETLTPLVQRLAPAGYSSHVPDKAETWVRLIGALELAGGAMFATGIGRRLGALLLVKASAINAAIAWPDSAGSESERSEGRSKALTHGALLGAALVASRDLQGRPSLSYRTEKGVKRAGDKAEVAKGRAQRSAKRATKDARKKAKKVSKKIDAAVH